ncbi:MAG: Cas10/Cmr2 second palm domain-containing protein [Bryobacteraceae bacterium]
MSLQVFLQAQLLGAEEFLIARSSGHSESMADLIGRCAWLSLFCEVLPRALLSELKLSRMLLGSSSAEQFLLVLAEEDIARANEFLTRAADAVVTLSGDTLRLVWASTENLGAWPVARKRLDDALVEKSSTPLAANADPGFFAPLSQLPERDCDSYFSVFGQSLPQASRVGWSADRPAHLSWDEGQYSWRLEEQSSADEQAILFLRRFAMDETGTHPAPLGELAERADGAPRWGVLRGDVDHFDFRLRRAASIEEHIHLSVLFKEFFAGELALLCTLGDFWRKVSILYRGGDDFALIGTWDALVMLAREVERLFEKFVQQNFESFPSLEGKTISMALAIAPDLETSATAVFEEAGVQLRAAKATEAGSFHLFGRTLEWKRLGDAEDLKTGLVRLVRDFGYSPAYITDLAAVYREAFSARATRSNKPIRVDKPWRTYMRLSRVIPQARNKELNNVRSAVIGNLVGKKTAGFKLRPSARVGLEWARLAAGV